MKPVHVGAVLLPLVLLGSACSAAQESEDSTTPANSSNASEHGGGGHGDGEHGGGHAGGHGAHDASAALSAVLVDAADLPAGYREGHAHAESVAATAPDLDPACTPIAELVGEHPNVQQDQHPQASRSFSKSHYGPDLNERIIDYGSESAAADALDDLQQAAQDCARYVHSADSVGISRYAVEPGKVEYGDGEAVSLRLDAVGSDFDGLYWDVWATRAGDRLVAVGFRSARNGGNDDLQVAIPAVMSALGAS